MPLPPPERSFSLPSSSQTAQIPHPLPPRKCHSTDSEAAHRLLSTSTPPSVRGSIEAMARKMMIFRPVPNYRLWIYSVNGLIITVQLIIGYLAYSNLTNPYWSLIPLESTSLIGISFGGIFVVQWFACLCGLIGVFVSSRDFIRVYWLLMIPLLFTDVIMFGVACYQMMQVHLSYTLPESLAINPDVCETWKLFAKQFMCTPDCAPADGIGKSCTLQLLRWMHDRLDIIGILLYFVLFPLKLIVILALREDIQELFEEIIYNNGDGEYKHWALGDEDDMCDRELREKSETGTEDTNGSTQIFGA